MDSTIVKKQLLEKYAEYEPSRVVTMFEQLYPNPATASSQLSRFKSQLKKLSPPPDATYLDALKLAPEQYSSIIRAYRDKRDAKALDVSTINDADGIVAAAQSMLQSDDFRLLWPALVVVSGLRPADLMSIDTSPPVEEHKEPDFWVSLGGVAKKKKSDRRYEHPLLAPRVMFERGLAIVREYFQAEKLTKQQYSQRYSKYWDSLLKNAFGEIEANLTHVLLRRMFAKFAFLYFKDDFLPAVVTEHGFISFALMHDSTEPALTYANLSLGPPVGNYPLFVEGRKLQPFNGGGVLKKPKIHTLPN